MPLQTIIGLLGGTFDPIHYGHLRMAVEVQERLQLNAVHLTPNFLPPHRALPIASAADRMAMLEAAVSAEPTLIADAREIKRQKPSYTIDTVLEMRAEMPQQTLAVIMAIDAFLGFLSWHRFDEILQHAHLIVAHRPSFALPKAGSLATWMAARWQQDTAYIHQHQAGGILFCAIPALDISASGIRKQIAMKLNPRYLLPDEVYTYIKNHHVY